MMSSGELLGDTDIERHRGRTGEALLGQERIHMVSSPHRHRRYGKRRRLRHHHQRQRRRLIRGQRHRQKLRRRNPTAVQAGPITPRSTRNAAWKGRCVPLHGLQPSRRPVLCRRPRDSLWRRAWLAFQLLRVQLFGSQYVYFIIRRRRPARLRQRLFLKCYGA